MKAKVLAKGLLSLATCSLLLLGLTPRSNATVYNNGWGGSNNYFYSLYSSGGSSTMNFGSGGNYEINWNWCNDCIGGVGWGQGWWWHTIGYNCGWYQNNGGSRGIYGWTTGPLVEYYIVEDGYGSIQQAGTLGQYMGTTWSDGGQYDIYVHQQVNQPSIIGYQTFYQFMSLRKTPAPLGQNCTVTCSNHFQQWANHGMNLGTFNYQILYAESWNGQGGVNQTVW